MKNSVRNVVSEIGKMGLDDESSVAQNNTHTERFTIGALFNIKNINSQNTSTNLIKENSWHYFLKINNKNVDCLIDTGADINMMSYKVFKELNLKFDKESKEQCKKYNVYAYGGNRVPILSVSNILCIFENKTEPEYITFVITSLDCPTVIGLPTCVKLNLILKNFNLKIDQKTCDKIVIKYNDVFQGLGCLPYEHRIVLRKDAVPCIDPPRKVPFSLIEPLKRELDLMEKMQIIQKVNKPTLWVSSLVCTMKKNGGLRICLDPRNLNKNLLRCHYPIKNIDEVRSKLSKARYFSHLDAFSGFYNIKLAEESSDLCTFQTPFGRYKFLRLPFGINTATEFFL